MNQKIGFYKTAIICVFMPLLVLGILCNAGASQRHFLWSFGHDPAPVYLLGSIHLLKPDAYPLPPVIESAYAESTCVVFETDISKMNTPNIQKKMIALATYPKGQTLSESLPGETYRILVEKLNRLGLRAQNFEAYRPWFCAMNITHLELFRLGFNPVYGIDMHFFQKTRNSRKKMDYLEPIEFQLDLLGALDGEGQMSFLEQTLKELAVIEQMAADMVRFWQTGDTKRLAALLFKYKDEYPGIYDRLFFQRNKNWLPHIENLARKNEPSLVIVGAGHLVGKNGLLDLLKQRGYDIKQH
jgi:uncharacterized protein YbaP (TraB family)